MSLFISRSRSIGQSWALREYEREILEKKSRGSKVTELEKQTIAERVLSKIFRFPKKRTKVESMDKSDSGDARVVTPDYSKPYVSIDSGCRIGALSCSDKRSMLAHDIIYADNEPIEVMCKASSEIG